MSNKFSMKNIGIILLSVVVVGLSIYSYLQYTIIRDYESVQERQLLHVLTKINQSKLSIAQKKQIIHDIFQGWPEGQELGISISSSDASQQLCASGYTRAECNQFRVRAAYWQGQCENHGPALMCTYRDLYQDLITDYCMDCN